VTKKGLRKKIDKIKKLKKHINEMMILTADTKRAVFDFKDSKIFFKGKIYFFRYSEN